MWESLLAQLALTLAGRSIVSRILGTRGGPPSGGYEIPGPQISDTGYEIQPEPPPFVGPPLLPEVPPAQTPPSTPTPTPYPFVGPEYVLPSGGSEAPIGPPGTGGQTDTTLLGAALAFGRKSTAALERQLLRRYINSFFRGRRTLVYRGPTKVPTYARYILPGVAHLGRAGVAVIGSLFPSRIGYPGATDFEREFGRPGDYLLEDMQRRTLESPGLYPLEEFDVVRMPAPLPREPTSFGRRVIEAGGTYGTEWLRGELERLGVILPAGGGVRAPLGEIEVRAGPLPDVQVVNRATGGRIAPTGSTGATSPPPANVPSRSGPLGRLNRQTLNRALLAGSAVGLLQTLRRRGVSSGAAPATETALPIAPGDEIVGGGAPLPTPGLTPGLSPLPILGSSYFTSGTSSRTCSCEKRKRRRMRECRERANVKWAGGRKKGKLAGTKCVVWKT